MSRAVLITCDICKREIEEGYELQNIEIRIGHKNTLWDDVESDDYEDRETVSADYVSVNLRLDDVCKDCFDRLVEKIKGIKEKL